jgi:hypothetical protein
MSGRMVGCLVIAAILLVYYFGILGSNPDWFSQKAVVETLEDKTFFQRKPYDIAYEILGTTHTAMLTYQNEQGGTQQEIVDVPWTKTFKTTKKIFLYLSAQNRANHGDITANIFIDGRLFRTSKSSGGHTIATANGYIE